MNPQPLPVTCTRSFYIAQKLICKFEFQDGVRFYIYFDSDYELDADSVEEKNKVGIKFEQNSCGSEN